MGTCNGKLSPQSRCTSPLALHRAAQGTALSSLPLRCSTCSFPQGMFLGTTCKLFLLRHSHCKSDKAARPSGTMFKLHCCRISLVRPVRLPSTGDSVSVDFSSLAAKWKHFRAVNLVRPIGSSVKPLLLSFREVR